MKVINSANNFFSKLKGKSDLKKKKNYWKRIYKNFERFALEQKNVKFLAQGTLYPDVIESLSKVGKTSVTIKSHHNVGGLPKKMKLRLIEPLSELFKDEVRFIRQET